MKLPMLNICSTYNCPYYESNSCTKYIVSNHCPVLNVKSVEANQYALYIPEGKISYNKQLLIQMYVGSLIAEKKKMEDATGWDVVDTSV
jgi:hypothetical protein